MRDVIDAIAGHETIAAHAAETRFYRVHNDERLVRDFRSMVGKEAIQKWMRASWRLELPIGGVLGSFAFRRT